MTANARIADRTFELSVTNHHTAVVDGVAHEIRIGQKHGLLELMINGQRFKGFVTKKTETLFEVWVKHYCFEVHVEDYRADLLRRFSAADSKSDAGMIVCAPMPGLVTAIEVAVGDQIAVGTGLIILEAMKMENELRATVTGRVRSVEVVCNATVEKGQRLIVIEPDT